MAKLTVLILSFIVAAVLWNIREWGPALSVVAFLSCLTVSMIPAAIYDALVKRAERKKAEGRSIHRQIMGRIHRQGQPQMPTYTVLIDARSVNTFHGDSWKEIYEPEPAGKQNTRMGRSKS